MPTDPKATSPTAPGRKGTPMRPLPQGRVIAVFLGSFGLTMGVVLGTWFGVVRPGRPVPPPPAPVVVMAPAPVVLPPPAPVIEEPVVVADAEPVVVVEPPPAPKPAPVRRPAPRRPAPKPAPAPAPDAVADFLAEEAAVLAAPPPEPAPPPPPAVPPEAAAHDGWYQGKLQTKDMSLVLIFRPEGKLTGIITMTEGTEKEEVEATGTWTLTDGGATIALVESDAATPRVWSGRVSDGEVDGRLVDDSRVTRRFHVSR